MNRSEQPLDVWIYLEWAQNITDTKKSQIYYSNYSFTFALSPSLTSIARARVCTYMVSVRATKFKPSLWSIIAAVLSSPSSNFHPKDLVVANVFNQIEHRIMLIYSHCHISIEFRWMQMIHCVIRLQGSMQIIPSRVSWVIFEPFLDKCLKKIF